MTNDRKWYQVNEIFDAPQGEGLMVGRMATFVRLQGCTVGCEWCDTKYTWGKGGTRMTLQEIKDQVHYRHVVITGGEPLQWDLDSLIATLERDHYIQLETSGAYRQKGQYRPHWVTLSPKYTVDYQVQMTWAPNELKLVVDEHLDFALINRLQFQVSGNSSHILVPVVLMPEGHPPRPEMIKRTIEYLSRADTLSWRFGCRLHTWIGTQ